MSRHWCARCGKPAIFLAGCGWDYDMLHCTEKIDCGHEEELETSTEADDLDD